ncbi:DUF368 domain-containing protein [Clostridium vincentii]|uniref:DUF368 domain-containing protein n=1 Tax=Clostridium vincentii TaxID=52704 RepID=A0A2T0B8L9_9CLOT|nr:DUF368 domain-containing protein [Clostridium vincentii]PRR80195.1 hypothetical protein CLVI_30970 [Clostridium vincentii]
MYIINFIRGACMALADSVPGVSGGTIAFILGFYDEFINSLNTLVSTQSIKEKKKAIKFLLKLGIGWITAFILAVLFITSVFETHIYKISSLFIGFIIFAIPIIVKEDKKEIINKYKNIIFSIIGIVLVVAITYFNPSSGGDGMDLSTDNLSVGLGIYVFFTGMIAISAMVLPGISGSTLLLIFGLYAPIMSGIREVLSMNFAYLPVLIIFGLGVVSGIALTIKLIRYLLKNHRSKMIYFILGLMIGSIYAVIMGATTLEVPNDPMNLGTFSIVFFAIGGALILSLEKLKVVFEKK